MIDVRMELVIVGGSVPTAVNLIPFQFPSGFAGICCTLISDTFIIGGAIIIAPF